VGGSCPVAVVGPSVVDSDVGCGGAGVGGGGMLVV
jgi:hypothetical protein